VIKRFLVVILAIALLSMSACANYATGVDQRAVHEKAGPFTNPKVEDCKQPGDRGRDGIADNFYYYPAGPRSWLFDDSPQADYRDAAGNPVGGYKVYVKSPTKDEGVAGQAISILMPGEATMTLTDDCDLLKAFHKNFGRKFAAYSEKKGDSQVSQGFIDFLTAKFSPALQNGLNLALQSSTYDKPVSDANFRQEIQDKVAEDTLKSLNRSLGDDYFTGVTVSLFQPQLPSKIQDAIDQNEAAKQFNTKVETEIATMKQLVKILGPQGYIQYKALQDGKITILPVPEGSGVGLPSK
jgi:hypothetical protein